MAKKIVVEYLYLDLQACDRCIQTGNALDEVVATLAPALKIAGFEVSYNKIEMKTAEIAARYKFLSSPTIRVNGRDICKTVKENRCRCCGDISGTDVSCRVFGHGAKTYEVPPKEMLAEGILKAVFSPSKSGRPCRGYALPKNLRDFYDGKKHKKCRCSDNCC